MKATVEINNKNFAVDFSKPLDISLQISSDDKNPIAWYLEQPEISPVKMGDWIGKVSEGSSSTNFNNIAFNPHGHGTHTECLGHITHDFFSINQTLQNFMFDAILISVEPEKIGEDFIINKHQIEKALNNRKSAAIIIRTLPNNLNKKSLKYSNTNPPYLSEEAAIYIQSLDFKHLLIDLPSVDKEKDDGKLVAHKAFWNITDTKNLSNDTRFDCTITELIFVEDWVLDGLYLLNLQIASFENDAAPSKPILYKIEEL